MWGKTNILSLKFSREGSARPLFNQCQSRSSRVKISFTTRIGCVFLKLHQCSFCLWWHQYPIVYLIPSQEETADYICSLFSTLQAIPKLPSHKVNMVALWGDYLKFATLRSNEVEKLVEGDEVMAICESALQWMSSSTVLQCVPVQCAERFEMWWEHCRAEQSRAGQGKEEDDRASDTFPFHRQQGRGKKIHCLKQTEKKRQYICTWKGGRQYWVNAYSWDWNWLLAVISCK